MIIVKENNNTVIVGCDIVKQSEEFNYYILSNPTSDKKKRQYKNKIVFTGSKKECNEYLKNI